MVYGVPQQGDYRQQAVVIQYDMLAPWPVRECRNFWR